MVSEALAAAIDALLEAPLYELPQAEKAARLTPVLAGLTAHHRATCPAYRRLTDVLAGGERAIGALDEVPWLPAGLWKSHRLASIPDEAITTTLTSSGTTGQVPSRVFLDPRHRAPPEPGPGPDHDARPGPPAHADAHRRQP
jgi:hypothetical protein